MGDALAGSLQKALRDLPAEQQKLRAELAINSMLDASTAELDQLQLDLARKLFKKESEVTDALQKNLTATVRLYLTTLNKTAVKLDAALAPSREGVRFELNKALAEQAAREEAKRRAIAASGGLRLSWRDERALAEYKAQEKKHPIVMVCEASALCISLLIVLALGDAASGRHELTNPMKGAEVRRVTLQKPRRTTDALAAMDRERKADAASGEVGFKSAASLFTPEDLQVLRPVYAPNERHGTQTTNALIGLGASALPVISHLNHADTSNVTASEFT